LVSLLQAVVQQALLPLFNLHCRRGQMKVPVASLGASLEAAGNPLSSLSVSAVLQFLVVASEGVLSVEEPADNSPLGQPTMCLKFGEAFKLICGESAEKYHRPASCAGVVAKGFSMAMPSLEEDGRGARSKPTDALGKRWRKAQGAFYTDSAAVEQELEALRPGFLQGIEREAKRRMRDGSAFPELQHPVDSCHVKAEEPQQKVKAELRGIETTRATSSTHTAESGEDVPPVLQFLTKLCAHPDYKDQICHVQRYDARPPQFQAFSDLVSKCGKPLLSRSTLEALKCQLGIDKFFVHQKKALCAVMGEEKHLCLTTGTSSGKSLAFALPILEAFRRDPSSKALILFPTKALAQDQLGKLQRLFKAVCPALQVCTFDGDTPKTERAGLLKSCHVFLTNPDMLHFTILPSNTSWRHVLQNLRYVVLDEAHVFRGSFGTHVALLLRRFRRVLVHHGVSPLFIACSATIVNARSFFQQLLALQNADEVAIVDEDTAGRGDRDFCLWNPPPIEAGAEEGGGGGIEDAIQRREDLNARKRARFGEREGNRAAASLPPGVGYRTRSSPYDEAAWLIAQAMRNGHRTVCFLQVRAMVEIVLQAAHNLLEDNPALQRRVAGYRGGYAAAERRRLEQRLFNGDLLGVVATNALELGIDIGDLDLTLHVGVPPTVASVWQQAGRAGRRGRPSTAVLIAMDAPLEQHFCRHPEDFFQRSLEARLPDVGNEFLLRGHLLCAAAELPPLSLLDAERWFGAEVVRPVLDKCRAEGRLIAAPPKRGSTPESSNSGDTQLRHCPGKGKKSPKEEVNLRDIDPVQFQVIVRGNSSPLETLDQKLTYMRLHPGALYLNQRQTYFVENLDLDAKVAWVVPRDGKRIDYFTECREHSQVILAGGGQARPADLPKLPPEAGTPVVRCGAATVHWRMYGFKKRAKSDRRILDTVDLALPAVEFPSQAVWMDMPGSVLQPVAQAGHSVDRGGLHALEHAMLALAPLCCDLDSSELSCQHTRRDNDPNRYLLLLYETQKGGAGTVGKVHAKWERLLEDAVQLMEECPCEAGCPNCIVIANCGEYNHGLDKGAALRIGRALGLGKAEHLPHASATSIGEADNRGKITFFMQEAEKATPGSRPEPAAGEQVPALAAGVQLEDCLPPAVKEQPSAEATATNGSSEDGLGHPSREGPESSTESAACPGHCRVVACARPRAFKRRLNGSRPPPENSELATSTADVKCLDLD